MLGAQNIHAFGHPLFEMLQEPAGPPDESVDVLFQREIGQTDDPTLAEYNTKEMLPIEGLTDM